MNPKQHITIKDIAKTLNVSIVTVSKALRGHPDNSKDTKKLVREVAEKLGYTPNFAARNLSSRKSNTIGLIVPKIAHFFFGSVIEAIYDTAFLNNYDVALAVSQENADREKRHVETLLAMGVDGLIVSVSQQTKDPTIFEKVLGRNIPLVFMDRVLEIERTSQVTVDDKEGAFKAIEQAIKNGYRKIGYLGGNEEINIGANRLAGFSEAMNLYGVPINPEWIISAGFGEEDGYNGFMRVHESGNMPEFIFAVTYSVALGVYAAAADLAMRIPDDLDIICFGTRNASRLIKPELSYVNQPTDLLGKHSVELILEHLRDPENYMPKHVIIPTELVLRGTCVKNGRMATPSE